MGTVPSPAGLLSSLYPPLAPHDSDPETKTTSFHLTGFNRFHKVPVNPTELIVRAIPKHLAHSPLSSRASLVSSRVLTVSAETSVDALTRMYAALPHPDPTERTVFLHLGVNVSINHFFLELQARNEATFSCPDERGWTPIKIPIDDANPDITTTRRTSLPLEQLRARLRLQGHNVDISTDAGRFVCNWVYYNSLQMAARKDVVVLFVHVPPASVISVNEQTKFIADLMDTIAAMP